MLIVVRYSQRLCTGLWPSENAIKVSLCAIYDQLVALLLQIILEYLDLRYATWMQ